MWLRPQGQVTITTPTGEVSYDTATCGHCNNLFAVRGKRPEDIGGMCKECMKIICPSCVDKGCTPFEKKLEAWEAKHAALRSYQE